MKIISWNVNGLRTIWRRIFLNWFKKSKEDIVCLQEIKAQEKDMTAIIGKISAME